MQFVVRPAQTDRSLSRAGRRGGNTMPRERKTRESGKVVAGSRKISWPATIDEVEAAGYGYTGTAKECSCGKKMAWFITPAGKWMPISQLDDLRLVPHHA